MYGGYEPRDDSSPAARANGRIRWVLGIFLGLIAFFVVIGQFLTVWLNVAEFGEIFIRPLYYAFVGGIILSVIALFRVDLAHRRSLTWWGIRLILRMLRSKGYWEAMPPEYFDFSTFKLPPVKFVMWQLTKVVVGIAFLESRGFGMAVTVMLQGYDFQLDKILGIFNLPFAATPFDMTYAQSTVLPMMPTLTLLVAPLLSAIGIRLILLVGLTHIVKAFSPAFPEMAKERPQYRLPLATIEALVAIGFIWTAVNQFFPSQIDFNTKFVIGGTIIGGIAFAVYSYIDRRRKILLRPTRRTFYLRFLTVLIVLLVTLAAISIQGSIADARKVEWRGPYVSQQIAVNRFLADLDAVKEVPYNFSLQVVSPSSINDYASQNQELLGKIRLWDFNAGFAKLKPEIGLIPYIDFEDSDILRFNGTMYWSASMKPVLPKDVRAEDRWYATHLVYTHVPEGFLALDAHEGKIVDSSSLFKQRRVYYGEGGLLSNTWAAFPAGRQVSDEIGGYSYQGKGGLDISPPISWIFESNFLLSYPDRTIHINRYRDVYDRMNLLFPYFLYEFGGKKLDLYPVTDGQNSYWVVPLLVALDTSHVPWSTGNPFVRLTGYAIVDIYSGEVKIIVTGTDYFSKLFKAVYSDYVTEDVPTWLRSQLRYPEEFFDWRVSMYNFYHVKDPSIYVTASEFYEVPQGLQTYYIIAKPPDFDKPEFLGLLSLELRGAAGRNLAGYMIVRNDYPHLGEMRFYEVDIKSPTKLLGPSAVREALERDPEFATLRTLLREPRVGDNILYRVGEHDVYFIPVYTSPGGGVVTQLGTVAAVGATFTGEYYVGLAKGGSAQEAFKSFLAKLAGTEAPPPPPTKDRGVRISEFSKILENLRLQVLSPQKISANVEFIEGTGVFKSDQDRDRATQLLRSFVERWVTPFGSDRVLTWSEGSKVNYGSAVVVRGVVELHYVSIDFG